MRIEHFRITEAAKLAVLADLAAAKGYSDLADDIRAAARVLVDGKPAAGSAPAVACGIAAPASGGAGDLLAQ